MGRSNGSLRGHLAALAVVLLTGLVLAGCGGGDETTEADEPTGFGPNVVTDDDIAAQEEGSAGRGLLEWWQAAQFRDAATVLSLTTKDTIEELGKGDLEELIKTRGQGFQGLEILGVSENGNQASVRAGLLTFQPEEPGGPVPDEPSASAPVTFVMADEGGAWLFDSPEYLEPQIANMKAAEEAAGGDGSSGDEK